MTFETTCEQIRTEAKLLTDKELGDKIITWKLNEQLVIYVHVLEKERSYRKPKKQEVK